MKGGGHEKLIYRRELPKKGGLGQFVDLRGKAWQKRSGWAVFEGVSKKYYLVIDWLLVISFDVVRR